jgi:hypothetical protein
LLDAAVAAGGKKESNAARHVRLKSASPQSADMVEND